MADEDVDALWSLRTTLTVAVAELQALRVDAARWTGGRARVSPLAAQGQALEGVPSALAALGIVPGEATQMLFTAAAELGRDDDRWPLRNRNHRARIDRALQAVDRVLSAVDAALVARGAMPDDAGSGRGRGDRLTSNSRSSYSSVRNAG